MKFFTILFSTAAFIVAPCFAQKQKSTVSKELYGKTGDQTVMQYTLANKKGMQVKVIGYGATITYIAVPDKDGVFENVVLGYDSLNRYVAGTNYFGATIGRYANRIGGATFSLNGNTYNLAKNSGPHTLHGGLSGFNRKVFKTDTLYARGDSSVLALSYFSADMEEGFPGNLTLQVTYVLTAKNELKIEYRAKTDKPTVVNFTNHSYFNLSGCKEDVMNYQLMIVADSITPADNTLIPTGVLQAVVGTPFDFTSSRVIAENMKTLPRGYDINYALRKKGSELSLAAEAYDPKSGRLLQAYTTEPGIQLYTSNFLFQNNGYHGLQYRRHYGLCLEAQHFPDSPNKPSFPSTVLLPGQQYKQVTVYKFSVR
jgi:aldose 1-epimerase